MREFTTALVDVAELKRDIVRRELGPETTLVVNEIIDEQTLGKNNARALVMFKRSPGLLQVIVNAVDHPAGD